MDEIKILLRIRVVMVYFLLRIITKSLKGGTLMGRLMPRVVSIEMWNHKKNVTREW
jgi:hypothetical protein